MQEMSYEPLFTLLGLMVVVSPLLLTIVLGVSSLVDWKLPEKAISQPGLRDDRLGADGGCTRAAS